MSFNEGAQLDTSQVRSGGGGRGGPGMVAGGGVGALILLVLGLIFGFDPGSLPGGGGGGGGLNDPGNVQAGGQVDDGSFDHCKTGADANRDVNCRIIGTVNSVQNYWSNELPRHGMEWQPTQTVLYSGQTQSACGTASNQVGPFYCPLDKLIYIDSDFFQILEQQFGSSGGPLAQMYVVAHEYGHALQDQLNLLGRAQQDPQGPESGAVRIELMADCLGGVWAKHAAETTDAQGTTLIKPLTEKDIKDALSAAASVGDDRIQEKTQGRVTPENWTHGSAEARMRWFLQGYKTGDLNKCNTFAVDSVN